MELKKGQRLPLTQLFQGKVDCTNFRIGLTITGLNTDVDFACFGLDARQQLSDDRYAVFYNQPKTPCAGVELSPHGGDSTGYVCALTKLPSSIDRLVFTAALDGAQTMREMREGWLRFLVDQQEIARFAFSGADLQDEKALMLAEIYRKDGEWRVSAIGQGFNGGLSALVQHFGGVVADEPPPKLGKLSLEKKLAEKAPKLVDLAKKATVTLDKLQLSDTIARVGLVLDASGSMYGQYQNGKVQEVIERLLPLAVHFDDDGELDVWAFSNKVVDLPPATLQNYSDFVAKANKGWKKWGLMSINDEPGVLKKVISHYRSSKLPVLIIFISDGGVSQNKEIKNLLTEAAKLPIFWQFVGIGGRNYGVLEKLDTMSGRVVDNCGFFALDDLHSVSEQELYERLLSEFPLWLQAAKNQNIIR